MESISANEGPVALDDISVAMHLQKQYQEAGFDPSLALNNDDLNDFGGVDNFRV